MDDQTGVKLEDLQMIVGGTTRDQTRDQSLYAIPKFRSVICVEKLLRICPQILDRAGEQDGFKIQAQWC